ncbi:MAG: metalloregulator ArsR/SmtB family transcription factor [Atopococcus tabaci]|uniref:Metalloregulator ArsR/SmtB family transcription factor n=1 Tax=Atopococcus tabaci TaxID=269774 RepID=A0AA43UDH2_9LACT|nr:metalloregulator ArsR/SmtB family transcription factor [Atopococcus tabaci]
MNYEELANILKAIADPNRLKILEVISCGGKRACDVLEFFDFTQPTLSHHMKTLTEAGLVNKSRDGRWIFYSINEEAAAYVNRELCHLLSDTEDDCLCQKMPISEEGIKEEA